jgi:glycosyltransferase involved in cell wall biosynthesis
VFHFGSSLRRKNSLALVQAFRIAFGDEPRTRLILKTSDGHRYPAEKARLLQAVASSRNIILIDEMWEQTKVQHLIRTADLYGSLHRSEGFGLPLAEAMMLGTPVLTTNWSGNTDFCDPDQTYAVDGRLVPFHDTHSDYEGVTGAQWADPSVEHAAAQLKRARDDGEAARNKALAARGSLIAYLSNSTYDQALRALGAPALAPSPMPERDVATAVVPTRAHSVEDACVSQPLHR